MGKTIIKNGLVINPDTAFHQKADVLIDENGRIAGIGPDIQAEHAEIVDATGLLVTPGLVDIHVHFRDPGYPEKETIETGSRSAAAGGFTAVVCMPNTKPALDSKESIEYVYRTAARTSDIHIYSSAAITYGLKGEQMTDFDALYEAGAVTFTDDGRTVMDPGILYAAFQKAALLDVPISSHCEDHRFIRRGAIHLGEVSRKLGVPGIHPLGEELIIARDILFAEATGARLHIQHVSTARGVQLIREAKARGVRVTAEAAPHHFTLTDEKVLECGTLAKVNPPLRTPADVEAVTEGLADGTIDAIATDHAPHTLEEKVRSLELAPFGLVGLETCVGLVFTRLVHTGKLTIDDAIAKLTIIPARIMNLPHGKLEVNGWADIALIDPDREWVVNPAEFRSRSKNTPFAGMKLKGKPVATFVKGKMVFRDSRF